MCKPAGAGPTIPIPNLKATETGTVFDVQGVEGRVELVQSRRGNWRGSSGAQYSHVDFEAIGAEAFVPPERNREFRPVHPAGTRFRRHRSRGRWPVRDNFDQRGQFSTASAASIPCPARWACHTRCSTTSALGVNMSRAERAPSAQELFADGPHIATQQFEIGNDGLDVEGAWGIEGYVRGAVGPVQVNASLYRNWFDDFIFLAADGTQEDGLDVYRFLQTDADQWGLEGQLSFPLLHDGNFTLLGDLRGDYTQATLDNGDPVPRIPPLEPCRGAGSADRPFRRPRRSGMERQPDPISPRWNRRPTALPTSICRWLGTPLKAGTISRCWRRWTMSSTKKGAATPASPRNSCRCRDATSS